MSLVSCVFFIFIIEMGDDSMTYNDISAKNIAGKSKAHYLNGISDKWCYPVEDGIKNKPKTADDSSKKSKTYCVTVFSPQLPAGRCTLYVPEYCVNKRPNGRNNVALYGETVMLAYFEQGKRKTTRLSTEAVAKAWQDNAQQKKARRLPHVDIPEDTESTIDIDF